MLNLANLGIIAGNGDLPDEVANIYKTQGGKCYIASIDPEKTYSDFPYQQFALGAVGAILGYFQKNDVENIVIIGGIARPDLKSLKVDMSGTMLLASILKRKIMGDDNILTVISNYIEKKGFKVIAPQEILTMTNYSNNIVSQKQPSREDMLDIELGRKISSSLGVYDVGQSIIICDRYVLGIEAAEGTDNLIRRCAAFRKSSKGGVLVKMSKPGQDMRLDVPVIGPQTIRELASYGFKGLAIEQAGVIIVKPEETRKVLDDNELFIVGF